MLLPNPAVLDAMRRQMLGGDDPKPLPMMVGPEPTVPTGPLGPAPPPTVPPPRVPGYDEAVDAVVEATAARYPSMDSQSLRVLEQNRRLLDSLDPESREGLARSVEAMLPRGTVGVGEPVSATEGSYDDTPSARIRKAIRDAHYTNFQQVGEAAKIARENAQRVATQAFAQVLGPATLRAFTGANISYDVDGALGRMDDANSAVLKADEDLRKLSGTWEADRDLALAQFDAKAAADAFDRQRELAAEGRKVEEHGWAREDQEIQRQEAESARYTEEMKRVNDAYDDLIETGSAQRRPGIIAQRFGLYTEDGELDLEMAQEFARIIDDEVAAEHAKGQFDAALVKQKMRVEAERVRYIAAQRGRQYALTALTRAQTSTEGARQSLIAAQTEAAQVQTEQRRLDLEQDRLPSWEESPETRAFGIPSRQRDEMIDQLTLRSQTKQRILHNRALQGDQDAIKELNARRYPGSEEWSPSLNGYVAARESFLSEEEQARYLGLRRAELRHQRLGEAAEVYADSGLTLEQIEQELRMSQQYSASDANLLIQALRPLLAPEE